MFQKLLNLAKKRGEIVVVDPETGEPFILKPLEDEMEDFVPDLSNFEWEDNDDDTDIDNLPIGSPAEDWLPEAGVDEMNDETVEIPGLEPTPSFVEAAGDRSWEKPVFEPDFSVEEPTPVAEETPGLTDQGLIDKIDRDIAKWKAEQKMTEVSEEKSAGAVVSLDDLTLAPLPGEEVASEAGETEEKFYIEPVE